MKQAIRRQMHGSLAPQGASDVIQQRLLDQDWWAAGFQVGLYRSTPAEPDTGRLLDDLLARGAQVAVPVRQGRGYGWGWVTADTVWISGAHGILEPQQAAAARPEELRIIVVPGVAFDARGGRVGHGRGHFDRLLAQSQALRVGLCFENRLVAAVPMEPHDVRMDAVVTEKNLYFAATAEAKLEKLTG